MRIRTELFLAAAAVLIPAFMIGAVAVDKAREGERQAALRGLRETVRATALLVDGEVQRSLGALNALANSEHLNTGDMRAFYEQAAAINRPPDVWTLLLDESGSQVFNTVVPFGTPPPPPGARERVAKVLATQQPLVTDVVIGPATGKLLTTLYVPTKTVNGKRYVIAQAFSVEHWKKTALQPLGQAALIVAVIDRAGKFISRSQKSDELLGRPARAELVAAAAASNDGLIRHETLEGVDAYDAFTHSALTGWTIAVAAPVSSIETSANQAVLWLAAGMATALAAATAAAFLLGRKFIRAIDTASDAARAIGKGSQPALPRSSWNEVEALNETLADAGRLLAAEHSSREAVEAEREELLAREKAAREAAQAENAAKDRFLAMLGHELRNPLAAISGATAILARGGTEPVASQRYLDIIGRQNRHLTHIINDLLDVSRLLSGKVVLEREPLNVADCVRACVDAVRTTDAAAGYRLEVEAEDVWVDGDPVRLEQILNNLIGNALKYSFVDGEIRVAVRAAGSQAVIEVADAGAGIRAALLPRVFDPFVQGPGSGARPQSGLGIGLALVKQLVELHGGEVSARSDGEGAGATFLVVLPSIAPPRSSWPTPARSAPRAARVLLVEDNIDARTTTAELLRTLGHDVAEAGNGDDALAQAAEWEPDVIVMDIGLPGRDGNQIAAQLKKNAALRHIPLIAVTGYGQERDRVKALSVGFVELLVKPVAPDQLARAIDDQLKPRFETA